MIYTNITKIALKICFEAHKEQSDKSGLPYVFHPFHLAEQMTSEEACVCALLHDVMEDTPITAEDLVQMGIPREYTEVLSLLCHKEGVPYMDYVRALSKNKTAREVKIADLRHNSDLSRLSTVDEKALERVKKYKEALDFLLNIGDEQ